ncbi:helix-turn-helix domain-containing protein [Actinomadura parmotrematis]|uniref:DUF4115 domain-containing protein n=1 Tax=Actinomadura parmotrematis TaxID=2864039 RepID=A0ABS7FTJ0_9ACTN|nr:helix-turn-helix domain-containing protein [Actinomadura parmotrematis]MBW8483631.1 DUF4115 domain-containing protein [Actinomadura parmotrematis]
MSIGETLADGRRRAGLTVTQVSQRTRIRETVIRGIENDDYASCGGNFYARGHIRSIARAVGVDPDPLVRDFDEAHGGAPQPVSAVAAFEPEKPVAFRERRTPNWTAAMAFAVAALLVVGLFQVAGDRDGGERHTARQVAAAPQPSPSPTAGQDAAQAAQPARTKVELKVTARRGVWVRVRADKKTIFDGVIGKGRDRSWKGRKKITILTDDMRALRLTVNGEAFKATRRDGLVRYSFGLDDPRPA